MLPYRDESVEEEVVGGERGGRGIYDSPVNTKPLGPGAATVATRIYMPRFCQDCGRPTSWRQWFVKMAGGGGDPYGAMGTIGAKAFCDGCPVVGETQRLTRGQAFAAGKLDGLVRWLVAGGKDATRLLDLCHGLEIADDGTFRVLAAPEVIAQMPPVHAPLRLEAGWHGRS